MRKQTICVNKPTKNHNHQHKYEKSLNRPPFSLHSAVLGHCRDELVTVDSLSQRVTIRGLAAEFIIKRQHF